MLQHGVDAYPSQTGVWDGERTEVRDGGKKQSIIILMVRAKAQKQ